MRYPQALWRAGPDFKQGYAAYPSPQRKEGFVLHSMEGSLAGAIGELDKPTRQASWQFSVTKGGVVYQHYEVNAVCWHCGLPGDADSWTAAIGNVALIGIEHEGVAGEPLTALQLGASIDLQRWCYSVLPSLKTPALRSSHWEHGWLSQTSCPSGRVPWMPIIAALTAPPAQEDEMTQAQIDSILNAIKDLKAQVVADAPIYVKMIGFTPIYRLDEDAQRLVHAVNPGVYTAQTPSVYAEYPSEHVIWNLEAVFPGGVPRGPLRP